VLVLLAALPMVVHPSLPLLPMGQQPPPAIQRLIEKQMAGAELTDGEAKTLDDWQERAAGEAQRAVIDPATSSPQAAAAARAAGAAPLCPQRAGDSTPAAPTPAGYARLLEELGREYAKRLGPGAKALDRWLEQAKGDVAGSNAALPLSMAGLAQEAIYVSIWSCRRKPGAALFASNLGSLLDGAGDPRAGPLLAHAVALAPGAVLPRLNLGWLQFHRGDLAAATASFGAVAWTAPRSGAVLLGQGMVAHCEGNHRRAAELLSRALSSMSSPAAEQALDESRGRESEQPAVPPAAISIPRRDDWTRGAPTARVSVAEPIVPGSNEALIHGGLARNAALVESYDARTKALLARQQRLDPNAGRDRAPVRTATSVTLFRSDDAMAALARAQHAAYAAKIRGVRAPFERDFKAQQDRVSTRVRAIHEAAVADPAHYLEKYCAAVKPALEQEYSRFRGSWRGTWEAEQKLIREYGETAGATISQIRHGDLRRYIDVERQLHVITWALDGPADVISWGPHGGAIMPCGYPGQPEPQEPVAPSGDAAEAPCPPFLQNGFGIDCGIASVSLDCEKLTVQGGEGLIGRFEQNYVRHEQTFYLGVGVDATAGVGPLSAGVEGSVGAFVTTGGGQFRDVGYTASAGASAGPFSMEAGVTVGAVSGPTTSSSAGFNAGPVSVPLR